jgi:transcriptional regulator with XRE-family HTH domain
MRVSEIATTLGITSLRWYAWEIGKSPIPARFAKKIRSLLGVSLDDLLP